MADSPASPTGVQRFLARLNALDHPSWMEAASLGAQLVDLSAEEFAIRDALADLELFLATGEVIQRDASTGEAYQSGWWYDQRTVHVKTPNGDRIHRSGTHPDAAIHPTAFVDPTARVEAGATVGPHARIGRYAHIARDAAIGAHGVIQDGAWIGTNAQVGQHAWVSHGTTVEPHCTIGHHATIGAGSTVTQGAQVEPYSRLGAGTTTSTTPTPRNHRGAHIANAIENIMRLDRE